MTSLQSPSPVDGHAFNSAVNRTLERVRGISDQRGGEYEDTWHLNNLRTTFTEHVLNLVGVEPPDREWLRLLVVASLIDVKDSRMLGPWRTDTVDDGINYRAAFTDWMDQYLAHAEWVVQRVG